MMIGTLVNTGAVVAGSAIGLAAGTRLPERIKIVLMQALGLAVVAIGLRMALEAQHTLLAIACLLLGGVTGELLRIEQRLDNLAETLSRTLRSNSSRFVEGFVTATLLYLTGAMTIVGSIQDGTIGDPSVLLVKSLLDGVASVALASSLGVGVMFSALPVLLVQGGITLLAQDNIGNICALTYFGRASYSAKKLLPVGEKRWVVGRLDRYGDMLQIVHPDHVEEEGGDTLGRLCEPVYPLSEGLTQPKVAGLVAQSLSRLPELPEWIEPSQFDKQAWPNWSDALKLAHKGENANARDRLAYDELLANSLALMLVRADNRRRKGQPLQGDGSLRAKLQLPYQLTGAQARSVHEIEGAGIQLLAKAPQRLPLESDIRRVGHRQVDGPGHFGPAAQGIGHPVHGRREPFGVDENGAIRQLARRLEILPVANMGDQGDIGDLCERTGVFEADDRQRRPSRVAGFGKKQDARTERERQQIGSSF